MVCSYIRLCILYHWIWYSVLELVCYRYSCFCLGHNTYRFTRHIIFSVYYRNAFLQKTDNRNFARDVKKYSQYIYIYILTVFTFCMMIVMHGIIPSLFVAVITAIVTICLMCICPIPKWLAAIFEYLGDHSTNIWLTHMFFYMNLFNGLVFRVKYPILIFLFMLSLSLISSYIINLICKPILKNLR